MYIAIDIGGTKTEVAFFNGKDPRSLIESKTFPTDQNYTVARQALFKVIDELLQNRQIQSIHVSFPGLIRGTEILQSNNIPDYCDRPLKSELEQRFKVPVSILQDSVCAAIAEYVYGNLSQYIKIVYLILGTGIGGAAVQRSCERIIVSPLEPGGMVVDMSGARDHGFTQTLGILEAYVGGGNVEKHYQLNLADVPDGHKHWAEITDYLAAGINNLNCILMPDVVIIGGGIGFKRQAALRPVVKKVQRIKNLCGLPGLNSQKLTEILVCSVLLLPILLAALS